MKAVHAWIPPAILAACLAGFPDTMSMAANVEGSAAGYEVKYPEDSGRATPTRVGPLGDVDRLRFTGADAYSADELRGSLDLHLTYQLAALPHVPLDDLLRTIERMLLAGYQHDGFRDARVEAALSDSCEAIEVAITEGRRFTCGDIIITGLRALSVDELLTRVQSRLAGITEGVEGKRVTPGNCATVVSQPPTVRAGLWIMMRPVSFNEGALDSYGEAVRRSFAELGRFNPRFDISLAVREDVKLADLVITVHDEGPPCRVGTIEVVGTEANTAEDVQAFLDLHPGQRVDLDDLSAMKEKLYSSGRFLSFDIAPTEIAEDGRMHLKIVVRENPHAPRLATPLTPREEALVQVCRWLSNLDRQDVDLVLTAAATHPGHGQVFDGTLVWSPRRGLLLRASVHAAGRVPRDAGYALLLTPETVGFHVLHDGRKLTLEGAAESLSFIVRLNAEAMTFGSSFSSVGDGGPVTADITVAPGFGLRVAGMPAFHWEDEGPWLRGACADVSFRLDRNSGRISSIEWSQIVDADRASVDLEGELTFREQAFRQAVAALAEETGALEECYDPGQGCVSSLKFLLNEVFSWVPHLTREREAADRFLAAADVLERHATEVLGPVLAPYRHLQDGGRGRQILVIPPDPCAPAIDSLGMLSGWVLSRAGDLVPGESWPASLLRAAFLTKVGQVEAGMLEYGQLAQSRDLGPLGCVAASCTLRTCNPRAARHFALRGMECASRQQYRKDCRALMTGNSVLAVLLRSLAVEIGRLTDGELETLASVLGNADADMLRLCSSLMRDFPEGASVEQVLGPGLDAWWDAIGWKRVLRELQAIIEATSGAPTIQER